MIGDKLVITDYHRRSAAIVFPALIKKIEEIGVPLAVTIGGESGSGKSETAVVLAELCEEKGYKTLILQQDDYFILPPRTNHERRLEDIGWVGLQEVKLDKFNEDVGAVKSGREKTIRKPLVIFDENLLTEEEVDVEGIDVVIAEGTYATTIENAELRVFIDRDYRQTKKARLTRSRDPATDFLEKVLAIEHEIISGHKALADVVLPPPEEER
ncbi:MAG: hypothetical protein GX887_00660 [Firmicutes bacterium]|nr:hypothetical protein [Bacillota bacterium]